MSEPTKTADGSETLRASRLLAALGGDEELLLEIIAMFERESPVMLQCVRLESQSGDVEAIASAAHLLKGSVANFGHTAVFELAREIEQRARRGDLKGLPELVAQLERAHLEFLGALDRMRREVRS